MKKLLRASLITSMLFTALFLGGPVSIVYAETATAGTLSPYTKTPSCPTFTDKKAQCTYPNGQKATCTDITTTANRFTGVSLVLSCTNPDKSTSKCTTLSTGSQIEGECKVTNADGTSGGKIVQGQGGLGGTGGISTDSAGNKKDIPAASSDGTCGTLDVKCNVLKIPGLLLTGIGFMLLTLSSLILAIAGVVFNWVVIRTVFQFALYFGTSTGMLVAWGVLRDIANIALLFGFIFMGIATILNTQGMEGYTAKKALPRLIIFAVLLNFSLFATQAVIDVSNGFSSVFATYASEQCVTTTSSAGVNGQSNDECANIGISGKIIKAAGISSVFATGFTPVFDKPYTYAAMLIILSLLVTVAAMVLLAGAIMLVTRVVILSLLMVTSPIGFAGMAIPALQPLARDWWHKLINQAFFAPLYLLMIFISLKLVDGLQEGNTGIADALMGNTANSTGNSVATAATTAGNMQMIVVFFIVIGFMLAALMVAQKMGAYGAGFATKTAAGLTFGAHGFVARRTVGRVSGGIANTVASSQWARNNPGMGRAAYSFFNKGATASFSSRNMVGGALKGATGLDFGKANKDAGHGYHGIEKKAIDQRTEFAKKLTLSDKDKGEIKDSEQAIQNTESEIRRANGEQEEIQKGFKIREQDQKTADAPALGAARDELARKAAEVKRIRATGTDEEKKQAEIEYNNDVQTYQMMERAAQERLADIRGEAAAEKADHDKTIAKLREYSSAHTENVKFTKAQPQRQYANSIAHSGIPWPTVDKHANHEAAAKILKDINKSETQKMQDALDNFNTNTANSGGGGGHAPAPAPKPAGGGGGGHDAHAH